ncbi:MAG: hypothetical protein ACRCXA_05920 [Peptostreptococcaceae bacterium]
MKSFKTIPRGSYVIIIIFILLILTTLNMIYDDTQYLVKIGLYDVYISSEKIAIFKITIYILSIYGLIKNKIIWISLSTLVVLVIAIDKLKCFIENIYNSPYIYVEYGIEALVFSMSFPRPTP